MVCYYSLDENKEFKTINLNLTPNTRVVSLSFYKNNSFLVLFRCEATEENNKVHSKLAMFDFEEFSFEEESVDISGLMIKQRTFDFEAKMLSISSSRGLGSILGNSKIYFIDLEEDEEEDGEDDQENEDD